MPNNSPTHQRLAKIGSIYNHGKDIACDIKKLLAFIEQESQLREKALMQNVGMLRQWLNEDKITDHRNLVTNEDIIHWLIPHSNI